MEATATAPAPEAPTKPRDKDALPHVDSYFHVEEHAPVLLAMVRQFIEGSCQCGTHATDYRRHHDWCEFRRWCEQELLEAKRYLHYNVGTKHEPKLFPERDVPMSARQAAAQAPAVDIEAIVNQAVAAALAAVDAKRAAQPPAGPDLHPEAPK